MCVVRSFICMFIYLCGTRTALAILVDYDMGSRGTVHCIVPYCTVRSYLTVGRVPSYSAVYVYSYAVAPSATTRKQNNKTCHFCVLLSSFCAFSQFTRSVSHSHFPLPNSHEKHSQSNNNPSTLQYPQSRITVSSQGPPAPKAPAAARPCPFVWSG